MILKTILAALYLFIFASVWGRKVLINSIFASHSEMIRLFGFCVCIRYTR